MVRSMLLLYVVGELQLFFTLCSSLSMMSDFLWMELKDEPCLIFCVMYVTE